MNEQQLADLFSEQVDRMLQGETTDLPAGTNELQELLDIVGQPASQAHFQAGSAAQAVFQSLLAGWFGVMNGGSAMTILGLSKTWFISIVVTVVTIIGGAGVVAVIISSLFVFGPIGAVPVSPTAEPTAEATTEPTTQPTTEPTAEPTTQPTTEPTSEPTAEPTTEPTPALPTLIFQSHIFVATLCQGAYSTQSSLVNYGAAPVTDAALVWEVVEGAEFVDDVGINSGSLVQASNETEVDSSNSSGNSPVSVDNSSTSITNSTHRNFANFNEILVEQDIDLDIKVDVNDSWWDQPDGTEIRVALSVVNAVSIENGIIHNDTGDHNRGHGNDPDGYDEDNPGRGRGRGRGDDDDSGHNNHNHSGNVQIITIVKQGAQWVTLTGAAQDYGDQTLIVDGSIVVINQCTGLPPTPPAGSNVQVIGLLQPDGTFIAINITIINNIDIDFDSGKPMPDPDDGDDDGGGGGGGGCKHCGSGSGGS